MDCYKIPRLNVLTHLQQVGGRERWSGAGWLCIPLLLDGQWWYKWKIDPCWWVLIPCASEGFAATVPFFTFLQCESNRISLLHIKRENLSINPLCFLSANGEFPPVVATPSLPFGPTIKTPSPSIRSPPMSFPTPDYCKCELDQCHSAGSGWWAAPDVCVWGGGSLSPFASESLLFPHASNSQTCAACM